MYKRQTLLSVEEIEKIFKQSENSDNELLGLRDRCIIELLYSCGLRVSELCSLKINNLQFDSNVIRFFGKGNKERIIPLTFYAKGTNPGGGSFNEPYLVADNIINIDGDSKVFFVDEIEDGRYEILMGCLLYTSDAADD